MGAHDDDDEDEGEFGDSDVNVADIEDTININMKLFSIVSRHCAADEDDKIEETHGNVCNGKHSRQSPLGLQHHHEHQKQVFNWLK